MVSASLQRWVRAQSKACLLLGPWSTAMTMSRPLLLSPVSLSNSGSATTGIKVGSFTSLQLYSSSSSNTVSILDSSLFPENDLIWIVSFMSSLIDLPLIIWVKKKKFSCFYFGCEIEGGSVRWMVTWRAFYRGSWSWLGDSFFFLFVNFQLRV